VSEYILSICLNILIKLQEKKYKSVLSKAVLNAYSVVDVVL